MREITLILESLLTQFINYSSLIVNAYCQQYDADFSISALYFRPVLEVQIKDTVRQGAKFKFLSTSQMAS